MKYPDVLYDASLPNNKCEPLAAKVKKKQQKDFHVNVDM